jgi:hypothetical protein
MKKNIFYIFLLFNYSILVGQNFQNPLLLEKKEYEKLLIANKVYKVTSTTETFLNNRLKNNPKVKTIAKYDRNGKIVKEVFTTNHFTIGGSEVIDSEKILKNIQNYINEKKSNKVNSETKFERLNDTIFHVTCFSYDEKDNLIKLDHESHKGYNNPYQKNSFEYEYDDENNLKLEKYKAYRVINYKPKYGNGLKTFKKNDGITEIYDKVSGLTSFKREVYNNEKKLFKILMWDTRNINPKQTIYFLNENYKIIKIENENIKIEKNYDLSGKIIEKFEFDNNIKKSKTIYKYTPEKLLSEVVIFEYDANLTHAIKYEYDFFDD